MKFGKPAVHMLFQRISERVKTREQGKFSAENYSGDEKACAQRVFKNSI
jgi:hypothetical protein